MVVAEIEDNVLTARTAKSLTTPVIATTNYMVDVHALLIMVQSSELATQSLSFASRGSYTPQGVIITPNEYEEYLRPLKHPNLHLLLMLPKPIMSLLVLHIPLHFVHGFSTLEPLIISLVIRNFFPPLLLHHLYP